MFGRGGFQRLPETAKKQVRENVTNIEAEVGSGLLPLDPEAVSAVGTPVLLITGARSISLFRRLADRLEELLPNVERAEIPGAAPMMHADNPPAYNAAVLDLLDRQRRPGQAV